FHSLAPLAGRARGAGAGIDPARASKGHSREFPWSSEREERSVASRCAPGSARRIEPRTQLGGELGVALLLCARPRAQRGGARVAGGRGGGDGGGGGAEGAGGGPAARRRGLLREADRGGGIAQAGVGARREDPGEVVLHAQVLRAEAQRLAVGERGVGRAPRILEPRAALGLERGVARRERDRGVGRRERGRGIAGRGGGARERGAAGPLPS